jgi:hypothetical protein
MGTKRRIGVARTDASPPKRRPRSSTTTAARSGTPTRSPSPSRPVIGAEWKRQVVLYWSDARRTWAFILEVWEPGEPNRLFVGRVHVQAQNDVDIIKAYLDANYPHWMMQNMGTWTGVQNWIRQHAQLFVGPVDYYEIGRYELLAEGKRRGIS